MGHFSQLCLSPQSQPNSKLHHRGELCAFPHFLYTFKAIIVHTALRMQPTTQSAGESMASGSLCGLSYALTHIHTLECAKSTTLDTPGAWVVALEISEKIMLDFVAKLCCWRFTTCNSGVLFPSRLPAKSHDCYPFVPCSSKLLPPFRNDNANAPQSGIFSRI